MKTNANSTTSLEPSTRAADFAERVRMNQAKLTSELRPHYDFIVSGSGSSRFGGSAPAFYVHRKP
jgi:choline dehydrogenase